MFFPQKQEIKGDPIFVLKLLGSLAIIISPNPEHSRLPIHKML
jgi:hypothetical protein